MLLFTTVIMFYGVACFLLKGFSEIKCICVRECRPEKEEPKHAFRIVFNFPYKIVYYKNVVAQVILWKYTSSGLVTMVMTDYVVSSPSLSINCLPITLLFSKVTKWTSEVLMLRCSFHLPFQLLPHILVGSQRKPGRLGIAWVLYCYGFVNLVG